MVMGAMKVRVFLSFENATRTQLAVFIDCGLQSKHYLGAALEQTPPHNLMIKDAIQSQLFFVYEHGANQQTTPSIPTNIKPTDQLQDKTMAA
jgi:hypothetical protein